MGFASTTPFQILTQTALLSNYLHISTVAADSTLGDFTTPAYTGIPTYAYFDLICQGQHNDSAGANNIRNTSGLDHALSVDAIVYQTCGAWPDSLMNVGAQYYGIAPFRIPGTTNLASYIQPSTTYHVEVRNHVATANNYDLYNFYGELRLIFLRW